MLRDAMRQILAGCAAMAARAGSRDVTWLWCVGAA